MRLDPNDITLCVAGDAKNPDGPSPTSPPIHQTSLFTYPTFGDLVRALGDEYGNNVYSRGRNPTVQALENKLALLERGESCSCFGSGMGAISAILYGTLTKGDHVLFLNQVYGPTLQLAQHLERFGIEHDVLLDLSVEAVDAAIRPNTKLLWLESPGTMLFRMIDLEAIADLARSRGVITCIDNSWATPLLQKPLEYGIDIVVHSATKYLAGHSDVVAGAVVSTHEHMERLFYRSYLLGGAPLAPIDAWLLLRGLRTLPARLREHEAAGLRTADILRQHQAVETVFHPAFTGGPVAERYLKGYSGLLSFTLKRPSYEAVAAVIDGLQHFHPGVSWGGVESLAISPMRPGPWPEPHPLQLPAGLIRLSVGLEGANTLAEDLVQALDGLAE